MGTRKPRPGDTSGNPFDTADGYSGQDYHRDREAALTAQGPSGGVAAPQEDEPGPPEAGRHASFEAETGKVHGGGSGAGGGNPGEDHDDDSSGGSG